MIRFYSFMVLFFLIFIFSCSHEKMDLPTIPPADEQFTSIDDAEYILINPILSTNTGHNFNHPSDIYVGADNFVYVADTDNNRIVMMDAGGQIQGLSQFIPQPEAISQNDSLQLLIVNKTNKIYRIKLFEYNHQIAAAPVEVVFEQASLPTREFNGISVHNGFEYYVTVIDVADSNKNFKAFSFVYDFTASHTLKGPLPFFVNGTGLFSAILPTAIVSLREQWLDISSSREVTPAFMFTQKGRTSLLTNNFKVQHITTFISEGDEMLTPNVSYIGSDLYDPNLLYWPEDVAIDRNGFIFVMDSGRPVSDPDTTKPLPGFHRFSSTSGNRLQKLVGAGDGVTEFNNPKGIAVLPFLEDQIVYVADTGNNRVMLFKLSTD